MDALTIGLILLAVALIVTRNVVPAFLCVIMIAPVLVGFTPGIERTDENMALLMAAPAVAYLLFDRLRAVRRKYARQS